MPGLLLDDGSWKELQVPSALTIGRSSDNIIQPESQSVSKKHATFSIEIDHRGRQVSSIEDHSSRNGTFHGPSPYDREMMRVTGKATIPVNSYLKFGNSNTYFRYLEKKPEEAPMAYDPIAAGTALQQQQAHQSVLKRDDTDENLLINQENLTNSALVVAPLRSASPSESMLGTSTNGAGSLHSSQGSLGQVAVAPPVLASSQNMMISIQYPNGETNPMSIHIDPHGKGPPNASVYAGSTGHYRSDRSSGGLRESVERDIDRDIDRDRDRDIHHSPPRGSKERASRRWQDMDPSPNSSPAQGEIGRGVQRYISQASSSGHENDYDHDHHLPFS